MGLLKDLLFLVSELITLGGAGRLADARRAYDVIYRLYTNAFNEASACKQEIEKSVEVLGEKMAQAKSYLMVAEKIIRNESGGMHGIGVDIAEITLRRVETFNRSSGLAISVGVGSIAGGSLALGSWALVTACGYASTGIAISALSGVAATNATLAWFGGGAIAAGGAGMAGGIAVLGAVFAAPLVYLAAKGSHGKAKKLEEGQARLEEEIPKIREQLDSLKIVRDSINSRSYEIGALCYSFISDVIALTRILKPNGVWSSIGQEIRSLSGRRKYTEQQEEALRDLNTVVSRFVSSFDYDLGVRESLRADGVKN